MAGIVSDNRGQILLEKLDRNGKKIKVLVIGALGRCGRGAVDFFRKVGLDEWVAIVTSTRSCFCRSRGFGFGSSEESEISLWPCFRDLRDDIVKWDMAETAKGGPFKEILDGEIL